MTTAITFTFIYSLYSLEDDEVPLCELAVNEVGKEKASLTTQAYT